MLNELQVPTRFVRNHPNIGKAGPVRMGKMLIEKTMQICKLESLAQMRILDVGCGTRFSATIINNNIPIQSYTGVDVDKSVIDYLKDNVEAHDQRFDYAHWDVVNVLYNAGGGRQLKGQSELPLNASRTFDLIWMFSVITHQYPQDSLALFEILKRYANPTGRMFFTAFVDGAVNKFLDVLEDQPLMMAYYQSEYLLELLDATGWKVDDSVPADTNKPPLHQHGFLCSLK